MNVDIKVVQIEYLADHPEHVPELARLHFKEWGYLDPSETIGDRAERLRELCNCREIPTSFVAVLGDELVGSALLVAHDMKTRMAFTPWLAGVYVKKAHRRNGTGTRLILRVEEEAAALQASTLYLYTPSEEEYYSRRGWRLLERTEYKGIDVSVMRKAINTQPVVAASPENGADRQLSHRNAWYSKRGAIAGTGRPG